MKAGILYDNRCIRTGDAPEPRIGSDQVLVTPSYTGICGTDLHVCRSRVAYPAIPGHEFGGTIQEVGKDVKGFNREDRVVVDPIISCRIGRTGLYVPVVAKDNIGAMFEMVQYYRRHGG